MPSPNPTLTVSLLSPSEATSYMQIRHEAFKHDINKILYFNQPSASPATLSRVVTDVQDLLINKGVSFLKCTDTTTGEIIACARWHYHRPSPNSPLRTQEEVEAYLKIPEPYAESHPEVWESFFATLYQAKREIMVRRPYWALETLVTHPEHERRGAGTLLVQWGCDRADEAGVEAYLEASPMGEPLYRRFGFRTVRVVECDLRAWGGGECFRFMIMVRPAKSVRENGE